MKGSSSEEVNKVNFTTYCRDTIVDNIKVVHKVLNILKWRNLTNSVLNILKGAQLAPADYDYYHQDCPQSRYQEKKPKKSYSQAARGRRNNQNAHSQQKVLSQPNFTIPTANRFESLSGMRNQGNWY